MCSMYCTILTHRHAVIACVKMTQLRPHTHREREKKRFEVFKYIYHIIHDTETVAHIALQILDRRSFKCKHLCSLSCSNSSELSKEVKHYKRKVQSRNPWLSEHRAFFHQQLYSKRNSMFCTAAKN